MWKTKAGGWKTDPKSGMQTSKVDVLGDVVAQANFKLAQDGPQPGNPQT